MAWIVFYVGDTQHVARPLLTLVRRSSASMEAFLHPSTPSTTSVASIAYKKFHTRDRCAISYGPIQTTDAAGVYPPVVRVTPSARTSVRLSTITTALPLLRGRTSWSWKVRASLYPSSCLGDDDLADGWHYVSCAVDRVQLGPGQECRHDLLCAKLLLPLWQPGGDHGN